MSKKNIMNLADAYAAAVADTPQMPTPLERKLAVVKIEAARAALESALEQQAEPVAYYHPRNGFYWAKPTSIFAPTVVDVPPIPLYTTAAQREWVGLTDEEMSDTVADIDVNFGDLLWKVVCLTKIIEAKLKERNCD